MNSHVKNIIVLLLFVAVFCPLPSEARDLGAFTANVACEAYQSKNKKTNPGDVALVPGHIYSVVEVDRPQIWYRVVVDGASPPQRWVSGTCGKAILDDAGHAADARGGDCHVAGLEESYVFAVSWQPAFCESHPQKPECSITDPNSYQAKNFTLHGLWPNKSSCGTTYGFCGKQRQEKGSFCNYPDVGLDASVLKNLDVVMPSAAAGSCLQRHEWYKHGTCQTDWDNNGYFNIAIELVRQFNDAGMSAFMTQKVGKMVGKEEFLAKINSVFGDGASRRMKIICSGDSLVDIYINLPKKIGQADQLAALIQRGAEGAEYSCPSQFKVDAIGHQREVGGR